MLAGAVKVGEPGWDSPPWDGDVDEMDGLGDLLTEDEARSIAKEWVLIASRRATPSVTKPGQFIMDSAAGISVANERSWLNDKASMTRLPPGAASLSGVGGDKTSVTAVSGLFEPFGGVQVNHAEGSVANIISLPDIQEFAYVHIRDQRTPLDRMEISADEAGNEVIAVAPKDPVTRFYMMQAPDKKALMERPAQSTNNSASTPVLNIYRDAYSRGWSKNAIARALKVRQLHRAFSYVGLRRLEALVRSNRFGFDIGPREVSLYRELHDAGDCSACPLGKTTRSDQVTEDYTRSTQIGEVIVADIMEIKSKRLKTNKLALVTVDDMCTYAHVRHLPKKDLASVIAALTDICKDYESFGWTVKAIKLDGDGAFREIAPHIAAPLGVIVVPTSPYKHAVVAERMIRTLSTLFRCTLAGLPYTLAPHMFVNMLDFCASSNNLLPTSHNPVLSPTELFTRRSPEYAKLAKIEYGKLVTFHNPTTQNDDMRATVAVIVGRDAKRPGHALLWDLLKGGVVARNDFKPLAWNQALLRAYIDTALGSHEATGDEVAREAYYEPSDIQLSAQDIEDLCEDDAAEPGSLRGYEGVRLSSEAVEERRRSQAPQSKENRQKAVIRLIDLANASGELLGSHEDENGDSAAIDEGSEAANMESNMEEHGDSAAVDGGASAGAATMEGDASDAEEQRGASPKAADQQTVAEDARAEIRYLRHLHAEELRKPTGARTSSVIKSLTARALELQEWLRTPGSASPVVHKTSFIGRSTRERIGAIDPANLIPNRTRSGAVFTYYGVSHQVLNLSVKQAFAKLGEEDTAEALIGEMLQMADKKVWQAKSTDEMRELYRLGRVKNILPCSIFLKEKYDADKRYLKLKARLVAHGNRQILDELFGAKDVDSPTVSLAVVSMLIQLAAAGNWKKRVVDVAGAYLNADLKTPEYMRIPANVVAMIEGRLAKSGETMESVKQADGSVIVELQKALYGLRQAGREWYELLAHFLTSQGYVRSEVDKCLFTKTVGDIISHLAVYVDDILIVSNSDKEVDFITQALETRFGTISTQEGEIMSFVGIEILTDSAGNVRLRQRGYIVDILTHFGVEPEQTAEYPCSGNIMDAVKTSEAEFDVAVFKSGVMKMMYLSTRTRPDIAFAVSALACRAESPKQSDWERLVHLAKYLNATKDECLLFKYGGQIELSAFVDASFMTHRDMRGHTGYCIFADRIGSAAILYRSVKQKSVADSSTEGEVIALHELVQHLLWIVSIYESMGVPISKPIPVHNDNKSNLTLHSKDNVNFKGRSKYISRKYFSVFEHVDSGELKLIWTGTDDLVADFLTKAVHGGKFKKFKIEIGLHSAN